MNGSFGSVGARKYSIAPFPGTFARGNTYPSIAALHYAVNLSIKRTRGDKNWGVWWGGGRLVQLNQPKNLDKLVRRRFTESPGGTAPSELPPSFSASASAPCRQRPRFLSFICKNETHTRRPFIHQSARQCEGGQKTINETCAHAGRVGKQKKRPRVFNAVRVIPVEVYFIYAP